MTCQHNHVFVYLFEETSSMFEYKNAKLDSITESYESTPSAYFEVSCQDCEEVLSFRITDNDCPQWAATLYKDAYHHEYGVEY